jgi:hypothetical protein
MFQRFDWKLSTKPNDVPIIFILCMTVALTCLIVVLGLDCCLSTFYRAVTTRVLKFQLYSLLSTNLIDADPKGVVATIVKVYILALFQGSPLY